MGTLSKDATIATWAGAALIALADVSNTHTVLVGTALPFVFFSVANGCNARLVWAVDGGFIAGLLVNDPYLAFAASSLAFVCVVCV